MNESIEQSLLCVPKSNNNGKDENFVLKFLFLFIDIQRIPFNLRRKEILTFQYVAQLRCLSFPLALQIISDLLIQHQAVRIGFPDKSHPDFIIKFRASYRSVRRNGAARLCGGPC